MAHQPGPKGFDTGKQVNGWERPCLVDTLGLIDLEVVKEKRAAFTVLPRRWGVERIFAWRLNYRRHSKDYGVLTRNSEAFIQVAMIQLLVRRLAKK